jgi:hypothetical protein
MANTVRYYTQELLYALDSMEGADITHEEYLAVLASLQVELLQRAVIASEQFRSARPPVKQRTVDLDDYADNAF